MSALLLIVALSVSGKTPSGPPQRWQVGDEVVTIHAQTKELLDAAPGRIVRVSYNHGWRYTVQYGVWGEETLPREEARLMPPADWEKYMRRWWKKPFLIGGREIWPWDEWDD